MIAYHGHIRRAFEELNGGDLIDHFRGGATAVVKQLFLFDAQVSNPVQRILGREHTHDEAQEGRNSMRKQCEEEERRTKAKEEKEWYHETM